MLIENTLLGKIDKVQIAIDLLKRYERVALSYDDEGYYVGFSGGKDSLAIAILCVLAKVKFALHCNHTGLDVPELVHYVRDIKKWFKEKFEIDVIIHYPDETMWELIPRKLMPPTRRTRYCCDVLKEHGGIGRVCVMGVRWEESSRRKNNRSLIELNAYSNKKNKIKLNNDNDETRRQIEHCVMKGKHILNIIVNWSKEDVWELINNFKAPYCVKYDQGWDRLGCIGCPMSSNQEKELEEYPKYKENYLRAFRRMTQERKRKGRTYWINEEDAEEIMEWWIHGNVKNKTIEGQISMEIENLEEEE